MFWVFTVTIIVVHCYKIRGVAGVVCHSFEGFILRDLRVVIKGDIVRWVACVADSCKQSAQRLQFACSSFHENKKLFLIGYSGLVWYAPSDWQKIMITLQSRAYNKNKCNWISRSAGGADLLTWCLNIHVDYSFAIRYLIRRMLGPPIKISSKRGQNCTRKHTRVSLELLKL